MRTKKGFTLIELVVVIAIIAILAAIAIPAVISIVNQAGASAQATDAATIDQCCKTYYEGIKTGMINSGNFTAELSKDTIPSRTSGLRSKAVLAGKCTFAGALEYSGIYGDFAGKCDEFAYDAGGNIVAVIDDKVPDGCTRVAADGSTTFEAMHYVDR